MWVSVGQCGSRLLKGGASRRRERGGTAVLMGEFHYTIDAKGRVGFPPRFRDEMGEELVLTRWLDHCLVAFSMEEFERVADTFAQKGTAESRDVQRMLFASAQLVRPDRQGRILLTSALREHAGLEKEVTILGNRTHAELWDSEAWERYSRRLSESSDQMAAALAALGI